jgi:uncharacterized OsmC-like protein
MATADIRAAVERVQSVLARRPDLGLHADTAAVARWDHDVSVIARHPNGTEFRTDMPPELGGKGEALTPGWLMRAGLAACTVTCIALAAAARGIELETLEARAASHSGHARHSRHAGCRRRAVASAPREIELSVHQRARDVPAEQLRQLVEDTRRCSVVASARWKIACRCAARSRSGSQ